MMRNLLTAGMGVLLALTAGLARAEEPTEKLLNPAEVARQLQEIKQQLTDLRRDLDSLHRDVRDTSVTASSSTATLRELRDRLDVLQRMVVRHDDVVKSAVERRFSFPAQPLGTTGTLRLENHSAGGATIIVNGSANYLQPYEVRTLASQPAGSFTYEVAADGFGLIVPRVTRTLNAGQVFTVSVNP